MKYLLPGLILGIAVTAVVVQTFLTDASPVRHEGPKGDQAGARTSVTALGRLEPKGTVLSIAAPSGNEGNRLEALYVAEGDAVEVGQLLGTMDTFQRRQAAVGEARRKLEVAEARLEQVKAGNKQGEIQAAQALFASAQHEAAVSERNRRRAELLKESKAISDAEVDRLRLAHEHALEALRRMEAQLAAVSEVREVDIRLAAADVEQTRASIEVAQAALQATEIRALSAGRVLRIHTHPGEQVSESGLLDLGRVDEMQAVAEVFEGDLPAIEPGQRATVQLDATGDCVDGVVAEIGNMVARKVVLTNDPVSDTDARVVEVRIDLKPSHFAWLWRMSNARVQVRIETAAP